MLYVIQNHPEVPAGSFVPYLWEMNVPFAIVRPDQGETLPDPEGADGVIVLGGYMGVHDEAAHPFLRSLKRWMRDAVVAEVPLFGICLGGQLLAEVMGGRVDSRQRGERGVCTVELTPAAADDPLFAGLSPAFGAFAWHNDSFELPPGAIHLAQTPVCPGQAFRIGAAWGVQFHPEVDRAIVAVWSRTEGPKNRHLASFAAVEAAHRALGCQLLENFLRYCRLLPSLVSTPVSPECSDSGIAPPTTSAKRTATVDKKHAPHA